ncbi:MAG: phospho-sugar mutase [Caldicoprobacterales bacterium]|jgi:phosphoglucomutase|nr:phospho-sugar mutase [Clostridiales bacterium]
MEFKLRYQRWLDSPIIDNETKEELRSISGNEKEIEDRFYKNLEFGTGGLRGVIGAGSNRMNLYTVGMATQGFANYIKEQGKDAMNRGVVIAYDSRRMSREFAERVALVLNGNGIKTFLYSELQPTPILSFSVRELGAIAGVVITASHNPPEYNGYKVYWEDGAQITLGRANDIIQEIDKIQDFDEIKDIPREVALKEGLLNIIGEEVLEKYFDKVKNLIHNPSLIEKMDDSISIIYTPLHGSGNKPVRRALKMAGFKNVTVVTEQELPDPEFSTVGYPNPEEERVFELAIGMAKARNNETDIIIGTDPDCDRVGVVAKNASGEYVMLTGNQIGALLTDYILGARKRADKLPQNGTIIKTIVTSRMGERIAQAYGVGVIDTLTGFKFIGEKIKEFEETGSHTYLFGYEESYGYLAGDFVRDKDGVSSSMLICEMAAYYKSKGMTLHDALIDLWNKYGYFYEELRSIEMEGKEGMERIQELMGDFRNDPPKELAGIRISVIDDYMDSKSYNLKTETTSTIELPVSDVLRYTLEDGSWFAIRPSGTEPKVKLYFSTIGSDMEEAKDKMRNLVDAVYARI